MKNKNITNSSTEFGKIVTFCAEYKTANFAKHSDLGVRFL